MNGRGAAIVGFVLVLVGAALLARELVPGIDLGRLWPVGAVILGIVLILLAFRPGQRPT